MGLLRLLLHGHAAVDDLGDEEEQGVSQAGQLSLPPCGMTPQGRGEDTDPEAF